MGLYANGKHISVYVDTATHQAFARLAAAESARAGRPVAMAEILRRLIQEHLLPDHPIRRSDVATTIDAPPATEDTAPAVAPPEFDKELAALLGKS